MLAKLLGWLRRPAAPRPAPHRAAPEPSVPAFAVDPLPASICPPELVAAAAEQVLARFRADAPGPESFPGTASRILAVIRRPDVEFNDLVRTVSQDAAIAARLLQVANSSVFGGATPAESVRAAALRLGAREVGQIALALAGRSLFQAEARVQYQLFRDRWDRLFHEAMTAGFAAGALALRVRGGQPDSAFLAGMFHDVGKPIALRALAAVYSDGGIDPRVFAAGIDEVLERVHVEIGAAMAATWSLPDGLAETIARHHDPDLDDDPGRTNVHVVRVVDGLCAARRKELGQDVRDGLMASAVVLRVSAAELRVAAAEVTEHAALVCRMFGVADPVRSASARAAATIPLRPVRPAARSS